MPGTYLNHYQDHLERIAEYSDLVTRLQTVDATLAQIETDIANIPGGGSGSAGSVISVNESQLVAPLILNSWWLDLIYLLGAAPTGWINPHGTKIINSASSVETGTVAQLTDRQINDFFTNNVSNSWVQIDFGSSRTINLSGIGIKSRNATPVSLPVNLTIEGSNNGSTFILIHSWLNIGFVAANQDKFVTFANSPAYRYIRIRQPGVNNTGSNFLTLGELYFYGIINNP